LSDPTEPIRRQRLAEINAEPGSREALQAQYGQVWTTQELSDDFDVIGFMAPYVVVRRKADGQKCSHRCMAALAEWNTGSPSPSLIRV
jgi:hypothetical protein